VNDRPVTPARRLNEIERIRRSLENPFETLMRNLPSVDSELTLCAGFEVFIKTRLIPNKVHQDTLNDYRYLQRRWRELYPNLMLKDLTPRVALSMFAVFYEGSPRSVEPRIMETDDGRIYRDPVQPARVAKLHKMMIAVVRYLVGMQLCDANILAAIQTVPMPTVIAASRKKPNRKKRLVSEEEMERILNSIPHHPTRDAIALMYLTGARPADIRRLHKDHITRVSDTFWYYDPPVHKTSHIGNARLVPLGPRSIEVLKRHVDLRHNTDGPVFRDKYGKPLSSQTLRKVILRRCNWLDIPKLTPRDLRTTYSNKIRAAYDERTAALMCCHTDDIAEKYYLTENLNKMAAVAKAML